jgi:hypothetical protein
MTLPHTLPAMGERAYRIAWQSKTTGSKGHGTTKMTLSDACNWCKELNEDWPDLDHWPDRVGEG